MASNSFIGDNRILKNFGGRQDGFAAVTCSGADIDKLIEYIKNQENHYSKILFNEELITLLEEHGIEFDERYLL